MLKDEPQSAPPAATGGDGVVLDVASAQAFLERLLCVDPQASDAQRVDQIRALEQVQHAAAAAQAEIAADFDVSQRAQQAAEGVRPERQGLGVAAQVALAKRQSHHQGKRFLGLATTLRAEMPHTWAAWRAGMLSQRRAVILAQGTVFLSLEDRRQIDLEVAGDMEEVAKLGDRRLEALVREKAYALDAEGAVRRSRKARADRRVTSRPAPDTMCYVSGLLPVEQGVAVIAALTKAADALVAAGDGRKRGQIMADTLVERVTGVVPARPVQDPTRWDSTPARAGTAGAGGAGPSVRDQAETVVPVTVNVVISDRALLGITDDPAQVEDHGPIPAEVARELIWRSHARGLAEMRRLYASPDSGALVGMESTARAFRGGLAQLIRLRDRICRNPWCDAPVRHVDHAKDAGQDGATSAANGQGLCEACNYAKSAPGWSARPRPGPRHDVETTTPTGHRYTSAAPRAPVDDGTVASRTSRMELHVSQLILTA